MWNLIPRRLIPPTRLIRYCCYALKEGGGKARFIATGVRWAESTKRKNRGMLEVQHSNINKKLTLMNDNDENRRTFESCQLKGRRIVNPIVGWQESDVWEYVFAEHICMNPLYGCGFHRVGCIGCPMASKMRKVEFARWPKYRELYIRAFDRMLEERRRRGLQQAWQTGLDVFHWWMEDGVLPGQMVLEEMEEEIL